MTQWELVACCQGISQRFLLPVIEALPAGFPFRTLGFHADNGSEYINHRVARLLARLQASYSDFLDEGITPESQHRIAHEHTDNEAA